MDFFRSPSLIWFRRHTGTCYPAIMGKFMLLGGEIFGISNSIP